MIYLAGHELLRAEGNNHHRAPGTCQIGGTAESIQQLTEVDIMASSESTKRRRRARFYTAYPLPRDGALS